MVLEICPILLWMSETIDEARGYNGILNGLIHFGLNISCEELIGLDYGCSIHDVLCVAR